MRKYFSASATHLKIGPGRQINKCDGHFDRWWKGRDRSASSDTQYCCCFVNWEIQRSVLKINMDIGGDEPVTHHLRYIHTMSNTIKWIVCG